MSEELIKKAFEYRRGLIPTSVYMPVYAYAALDVDRAYIAGAKELEEENKQNKKLLDELKEHCDELELINQKVMEENERLKLENEQLKQNLDGFLTETIAREEYKQTEELEELQRENKQLQEHLNKFSCNEIPNYNCKDCFQDLKQSLDWANERETEWSNRIEELKTDLEYAKAIITDLLNNSHEYSRQNAEQFIKGDVL